MDPVRSNLHDFPPNLAFSNLHSLHICYVDIIYLLDANPIMSSAEKLELLLQGRVTHNCYPQLLVDNPQVEYMVNRVIKKWAKDNRVKLE